MPICEFFGRIDSDKELVIQPQKLSFDISFREIADFFGLPLEQLLNALAIPNNAKFVFELYYVLFGEYGAMIPGELIDVDRRSDPPREIRGPAMSMDERGYTDFGIALAMILTLQERTNDFEKWKAPKLDFWVRMPIGLVDKQFPYIAVGPVGGRCVRIIPKAYPSEEMAQLSALRGKLEDELRLLSERQAAHAERRVSMEYARRVVLLNEMQWTARPKPYERQGAALEALGRLRTSIEALDRAVAIGHPSAAEKRAAGELLRYIAPSSKAAVPLMGLLELISEQPSALPSQQIDETLDEFRRCFVALSMSSLAQEFLTGHVISLLQEVVENLSPEVDALLADVGGDAFRELWTGGWREAFTTLRAPGDIKDDSPFRKLAKLGSRYEACLKVVVAGLNEATVPIVLSRIVRGTSGDAAANTRAIHTFATIMLRLIGAAASPHRLSSGGELLLGGQYISSWFEACAAALEGKDNARLTELGKEYKRLKFGTQLKSIPLFKSVSYLFSLASVASAVEKSEDGRWQSTGKLVVEVLKNIEGLGDLLFGHRVQYSIEAGAEATPEMFTKYLGGAATLLSFAITLGDTASRWGNLTPRKKVTASLGVASATLSVARLLPFVVAAGRLAAGLSVVGFVVGVAQFGLGILDEKRTPNTHKMFEAYYNHAMNVTDGPYDPALYRAEREALEAAWAGVSDGDILVTLHGPAGEADHVPSGGLPTWHLAYAMGFYAEHIIAMFDAEREDILRAHIRFTPGYEPDWMAEPDPPSARGAQNGGDSAPLV